MKRLVIIISLFFLIFSGYSQVDGLYKYKRNERTGQFDLVLDTTYAYASISKALSSGYGIVTFSYNGNNPKSVIVDTATLRTWILTINDTSYLHSSEKDTAWDEITFKDTTYFKSMIDIDGRIDLDDGGRSVFIGIGAGVNDDGTDNKNVFVGRGAGQFNIIGGNNLAAGYNALAQNKYGSDNVALGSYAGFYYRGISPVYTSTNSIFIGQYVLANADDETNQIVIGNEAIGNGSNTATIGDDNVTDVYMGENAGATIRAANAYLYAVPTASTEDTIIAKNANGSLYAIPYPAAGAASKDSLFWSRSPGGLLSPKTPTNDLAIFNNIYLDTSSTTTGIIYQDGETYLHTFSHPTGATAPPAGRNLFLGYQAGNLTLGSTATNSIYGSNNIGIGYTSSNALTTGYSNTSIGNESMVSSTTAHNNIAIGGQTLYTNTTGNSNVAIGDYSLYSLSGATPHYNIAIGSSALYSTTDGYWNTAIGGEAMTSNTTGNSNVAIGVFSFKYNIEGIWNVAIGRDAGRYITGGSTHNTLSDYSVYLGALTKAKSDTGINEIMIGYGVTGDGSNTATIGNQNVTDIYMSQDGGATVHTNKIITDGTNEDFEIDPDSIGKTVITGTVTQNAFESFNDGSYGRGVEFVVFDTVTHNAAAGWRELFLDGISLQMVITPSTIWSYKIQLVGITADAGAQQVYNITGVIERDAANNTTIAATNTSTIFESDANFDARATADDTNEALIIGVTDAGSSGVFMRWSATIRISALTFTTP